MGSPVLGTMVRPCADIQGRHEVQQGHGLREPLKALPSSKRVCDPDVSIEYISHPDSVAAAYNSIGVLRMTNSLYSQ